MSRMDGIQSQAREVFLKSHLRYSSHCWGWGQITNNLMKDGLTRRDIFETGSYLKNKMADQKPISQGRHSGFRETKLYHLQWVWSNKQSNAQWNLQTKRRRIVPGRTDPQFGLHRTDPPTTTCLIVFVVTVVLSISFDWIGESFDISGAFLPGKGMKQSFM